MACSICPIEHRVGLISRVFYKSARLHSIILPGNLSVLYIKNVFLQNNGQSLFALPHNVQCNISLIVNVIVLCTNIELKLRNLLHGPLHCNIGVT